MKKDYVVELELAALEFAQKFAMWRALPQAKAMTVNTIKARRDLYKAARAFACFAPPQPHETKSMQELIESVRKEG